MTDMTSNTSGTSQFSLTGHVAIVTGAGKGIGRACALALARAGADVALAARTQADLDAVAAEVRALGRKAIAVAGDISDEASMDTLVARTVAELGKVTILVNNAGGSGPNNPMKMTGAEFSAVLAWNVTPAYLMIQKTAKAALNQMTRNLAQDFGPAVRINAVEPGTILTDALAPFLTPERTERMNQSTPLGRLGQPDDIANAVLFLASPAASWITGKVLGVDGRVEAPNF